MASDPEPRSYDGRYGIINPYGDFWTHDTFDSEQAALDHLTKFWGNQPHHNSGFRVVPVRVTISLDPAGRAALEKRDE